VIKIRRTRWVGHIAHTGEMNSCKVLVRKPEWKRPLRRPGCGGEDYIRMNLGEIVWEGVYCMHLTQDRGQWWALVNIVMNL